ncbi:glycerol-3-phosphate 1-O-acyltransferase PlsY [soil metagenome]
MILYDIAAIAAAYALGSISFAIVFSRLFRLADPRSYGSGNPGATNVLRSGNKPAAILTLVFDALKGCTAVWLAEHYARRFGFSDLTIAAVAIAVFLGHLYPLWHRFQGGKGVATAIGILIAIDWQIALVALGVFVVVAALFRYVSLASLVAAIAATLAHALSVGVDPQALALFVMTVLLIWRHRLNVSRLAKGTESKLGASRRAAAGKP